MQFKLDESRLLFDLVLFNECNHPILRIVENELVFRPIAWDIEFVGTNLIVREAHQKILLDMEFQPPNRIEIKRGRLLCNGIELLIGPGWMINSDGESVFTYGQCVGRITDSIGVGFSIGPLPGLYSHWHIENVCRYTDKPRKAAKQWVKDNFPNVPDE
jgi:trigger factor